MKSFALTYMVLILLCSSIFAQDDPIGELDTISIGHISVSAGEEFSVSVNLWNDEELGAITLPLIYPVDKLEFQAVDFAGGRVEYLSMLPTLVDEAAGTILIGAVVIMEEFIQPGSGMICRINFRAKDGLSPGEIITIDSTTLSSSGQLMLTDGSGMANFTPAFRSGKITIAELNRPPIFTPIPDVYVAEGDSLYIDLQVNDADGDDVLIVNPIHPYNSEFVDNGDGTARFAWRPDYIGPLSADLSPFYFIFWTSDGSASSYIRVKVNIINVNRAPIISAPETIVAEAGDSLGINVSAFDPDFENIDWEISGLPSGASFDFDNPGLINWPSDFSDSGHYQITLIAHDPFSLSDTAVIEIELLPVTLFSIRIDTVTSFSGRTVDLNVYLKNKLVVREFNLLIRVDPTVLIPLGVSNTGTRSENLHIFDYRINENSINGNVRVSGKAGMGSPIESGEGPIFTLSLQISSDLSFVGHQIPIRFIQMFSTDNALVLDDGSIVYSPDINLFEGHVLIAASGAQMLGDINLNNIAYEISDAVYFSNFFISPTQYPLNDQQLFNSDINRDGYAPSIADLVLLVTVITGENEPPVAKPTTQSYPVSVEITNEETGLYLTIDSPDEIGGVYVRFTGEDISELAPVNLTEMDLMSRTKNGGWNGILMSYTQKSIEPGSQSVIKISDSRELNIQIEDIEIANTKGEILQIEKTATGVIPSQFELFQNAPNPFNPETNIRFNLHEPSRVTLTVFNILGQTVQVLRDGEFSAGQHEVMWDGTDNQGQPVASGVYLYRIKTGDNSATRKMVLLK